MRDIDIDYFHKLHLAGKTLTQIASMTGYKSDYSVYRRFKNAGLEIIPNKRTNYIRLDDDKIIINFNNGVSVNQLAKKFRVSRTTIVKRLNDHGIQARGRSESMVQRMENASPEERKKLTAKANETTRGRTIGFQELCNRAIGVEKACKIYRSELLASKVFNKLGIYPLFQKAIGPYNVDLFIEKDAIAVEIYGGGWHATGKASILFRKRFDYLLNAGILPCIVWVDKNFPLEVSVCKKIIILGKKSRHNKSIRSHEHVFRGDGQPTTCGSKNLNYRPGVFAAQ